MSRKASRNSSQVLLSVHLSITFAIPRELVLRIAQDLVNLVRLRVHATGYFEVDSVLFLVEFDGLDWHVVRRRDLITKSAEPHLLIKVQVLVVPAPPGWTLILLWDLGVGRLYRLRAHSVRSSSRSLGG